MLASAALRLRPPFDALPLPLVEAGFLVLAALPAGLEVLVGVEGLVAPLAALRLRLMPWNFWLWGKRGGSVEGDGGWGRDEV